MKVLVVGGAGYVGGVVVDELLAAGHTVTVYDNLLYEDMYRKEVPFCYGDVRDTTTLAAALFVADACIWLAALVGDQACQRYPELSVAINQEPLHWLADNFTGRIVFTSTCSVYGDAGEHCNEATAPNPLSLYAKTKLQAEEFLRRSNAIIFRLGTLFGVGDLFSRIRLDLVVNALTVKAHQEGIIPVYGGSQSRPLLHVRDVAKTIVQAVEGKERGIFNLHKENRHISEVAQLINGLVPPAHVRMYPPALGDTRDYSVCSAKAVTLLKFLPQISVVDGVKELLLLLAGGRLKDPDNPRYCNGKYLPLSALAALEKFDG